MYNATELDIWICPRCDSSIIFQGFSQWDQPLCPECDENMHPEGRPEWDDEKGWVPT